MKPLVLGCPIFAVRFPIHNCKQYHKQLRLIYVLSFAHRILTYYKAMLRMRLKVPFASQPMKHIGDEHYQVVIPNVYGLFPDSRRFVPMAYESLHRQNAHCEAQNQDELVLRNMFFPPAYEAVEKCHFVRSFHHSLIIVTVPFSFSLMMLDDFAEPFSSCL